jgi:hypothetical protein
MTFRISEPFYYKDHVVSRKSAEARKLGRPTNGQENMPAKKIEQGSHGAPRKIKVLMSTSTTSIPGFTASVLEESG